MLTKSLLTIILAALGVQPDIDAPKCAKPIEDHHFCCESVNSEGKGSGDGCVKISEDSVNSCSEVLGCTHGYTKSGGVVRCTGPQ